ncbi:MAG: Ig-like domain-containing protein [Terriglobales bacterium]|jgi:hypothetical protein
MWFHAFRRSRNTLLLAAALLLCAIALSGCGASGSQPSTAEVKLKSLLISPSSSTVILGAGQQYTVTGIYSNGSQKDLTQTASWSVSQPAVATISAPGMAVSKQPGMATITASTGSVSGSATLNVSTPTLVSLALSPSSPSIPKGETQQFSATGTFSDKSTQDMTSTVVWTASPAGAASINSAGLAAGRSVGTSTITATSGSISATDSLSVTPPVLTSMIITPAKSSIGLGTNEQLIAAGTFSDNSTQDMTKTVTWASSKPAVASIAAGGLATSLSIGATGISATSGSVSVTGAITVLPVAAVDYFSNAHNINAPDATLTLVNTGLTDGDLCAMIYVFDTSQEMNECCGCFVSQDAGTRALSINTDLTSNTLTGATLSTGVIRVVPADAASNPTCNAGTVTPSGLVLAWATHIQYFGSGTFEVTENDPRMPPLSSSELTNLESDCAFMQKLGSGHGICTCGTGD